MPGPRVDPVSDEKAGFFTRLAFWRAKKKLGKVPGPLRVVAHNPRVLIAYGMFETWIIGAQKVDPKIKTLASLRVAQLIGCPF